MVALVNVEDSPLALLAETVIPLGAGAERLASIHAGPRYRQLPNNIKSRFDALIPRIIEAAATTPGADDTLARFLDLMDAIGRRGAYLALLQQYLRPPTPAKPGSSKP